MNKILNLCAIIGVLKLLYGYKLKVFEKVVFRWIFVKKREEVTGR